MYFLIFLFILILILLLFILGGFWGAMWLPTKRRDYDRIAGLIDLRPEMVLYDLGSGSGNLLFYLSKKYKIRCVGIEISPILYLYSKIKSLFYNKVNPVYPRPEGQGFSSSYLKLPLSKVLSPGLSELYGVKIKYGDFFKHDLSDANIIYAFLHPRMYCRLKEKINNEANKDSTLILLSTWPFKNAEPLKISQEDRGNIYYLYKKADL